MMNKTNTTTTSTTFSSTTAASTIENHRLRNVTGTTLGRIQFFFFVVGSKQLLSFDQFFVSLYHEHTHPRTFTHTCTWTHLDSWIHVHTHFCPLATTPKHSHCTHSCSHSHTFILTHTRTRTCHLDLQDHTHMNSLTQTASQFFFFLSLSRSINLILSFHFGQPFVLALLWKKNFFGISKFLLPVTRYF